MDGNSNPVLLCVNHRDKQCGVHQFFKRLTTPLLNSTKYSVFYIDPAEEHEFHYWCDQLHPNIILYNFYTAATMPWLTPQKIQNWRGKFKQTCLFHEVPIDSLGFDLVFHQDPDNTGRSDYVPLARPIPRFTSSNAESKQENREITIGSFGFGLGGKGFTRVVTESAKLFSGTPIQVKLNIPYAKFGDESGAGARSWADDARRHCPQGVELIITHDFFEEADLLSWLARNDINCFFYDENYGRGISGTLDYALAVRKPIAITKSWQFKHVWSRDDSFLIEHNSLKDILERGTSHLDKFHEMWGDGPVLASFERGFDRLV